MKISLETIKAWCGANISPVAWQRIVIHMYGDLKGHGRDLKRLQCPDATDEFEGEEVRMLNEALRVLYQRQIPTDMLS